MLSWADMQLCVVLYRCTYIQSNCAARSSYSHDPVGRPSLFCVHLPIIVGALFTLGVTVTALTTSTQVCTAREGLRMRSGEFASVRRELHALVLSRKSAYLFGCAVFQVERTALRMLPACVCDNRSTLRWAYERRVTKRWSLAISLAVHCFEYAACCTRRMSPSRGTWRRQANGKT